MYKNRATTLCKHRSWLCFTCSSLIDTPYMYDITQTQQGTIYIQPKLETMNYNNKKCLPTGQDRVKHDYHDYADDMAGMVEQSPPKYGQEPSRFNCTEQSFPVKLHYMLNEIEKDGLSFIVSWQPHGRCFSVHHQALFESAILGR